MGWKKKEIEILKNNYPNLIISLEEISEKIKKTKSAIQHKATRLKIKRPRKIGIDIYKRKIRQKKASNKYYKKNKEEIYIRKRKRFQNLKRELVELLDGKCKICGYNNTIQALEFHHIQGNKENHMTRLIKDNSKQKVLKEIEKCILLCANCHRETHHKGA
ncbi:MAG: HNH endonuclease [Nanoarchaeota archaeon]|nr:HNH endonuclease [Nanoarchaeota archaeon]